MDIVQAISCLQDGRESLRNSNFIAKQHLSGVAFPATVAAGGDHESTRIVNVELGDSSGAVTRNDEEGNG